jgi:hypothetical protein
MVQDKDGKRKLRFCVSNEEAMRVHVKALMDEGLSKIVSVDPGVSISRTQDPTLVQCNPNIYPRPGHQP